jgi:chorismate mutase/prephenate dehydratase
MWEYVFFIDVSGHREDATLAPVLIKLADEVAMMRVLGSYPKAL